MPNHDSSIDVAAIVAAMRAQRPLVHNITNYVAMNWSANTLLALGASPAMVHAPEEVEEFVAISGALVVNIGTLSAPWVNAMKLAAAKANAADKPWVIDPVGVGATRYRMETCEALLALRPSIVRGNAAEVMALAGVQARSKGVDSVAASTEAIDEAKRLAQSLGAVVVASGETDFVTDGQRTAAISGGDAMVTQITATGCALSAAVAAMAAVEKNRFAAAVAACALFKTAAGRAATKATAPGSFAVAFLDALHDVSPADVARARIELS